VSWFAGYSPGIYSPTSSSRSGLFALHWAEICSPPTSPQADKSNLFWVVAWTLELHVVALQEWHNRVMRRPPTAVWRLWRKMLCDPTTLSEFMGNIDKHKKYIKNTSKEILDRCFFGRCYLGFFKFCFKFYNNKILWGNYTQKKVFLSNSKVSLVRLHPKFIKNKVEICVHLYFKIVWEYFRLDFKNVSSYKLTKGIFSLGSHDIVSFPISVSEFKDNWHIK